MNDIVKSLVFILACYLINMLEIIMKNKYLLIMVSKWIIHRYTEKAIDSYVKIIINGIVLSSNESMASAHKGIYGAKMGKIA